jgi:hypothetical protein
MGMPRLGRFSPASGRRVLRLGIGLLLRLLFILAAAALNAIVASSIRQASPVAISA